MPQKKNPKALEYAKSAAAYVTGALTTVLACAKNTALGDVNDGVTAINVPVLEAATHTRSVLGVMDGVPKTLTVCTERMRHLADIGFGSATELADVIVRTALDPAENIRLRTVVGGPANMGDMLKRRMLALENDRSAVAAVQSRIENATERLKSMAREIAG